jgi:hypothetical protein
MGKTHNEELLHFVLFTKYYDCKIKEDGMSGMYKTLGKMKNAYKIVAGKPKAR